MAFVLPPAPRRYSHDNENQTRRILENAFTALLSRLEKAEADLAAGVSPPTGPTASFTFVVNALQANFTDTSTPGSSPIVAWSWDFGDGTPLWPVQSPQHTYAAPGDYDVVLTVTDENDLQDSSAPVTVSVSSGAAAPLPAGVNGLELSQIGEGPGDDAGSPLWKSGVITPTTGDVVAEAVALINAARNIGMRLFLNFGGAPGQHTDPGPNGTIIFNEAEYEANVRRYTVAGGASVAQAQTIADALADFTVLAYVIDEPAHQKFNGSVTPTIVNNISLLHKEIWPGCLTVVRIDGEDITAFGTPAGGWTGVDYGVAQYEGHGIGANRRTMTQYFTTQKSILAGLDMGMVPSLNFVDGGIKVDLDGIAACWDAQANGGNGLLKGSYTGTAAIGTFFACGTAPSNENRFFPNPDWLRRFADIVSQDPDAPGVIGFSPYGPASVGTFGIPLWNRADMVAALDYYLTKCEQRPTFNGLRTPK